MFFIFWRLHQSNPFSKLNRKQSGNKTFYKSDINSQLWFFVPRKWWGMTFRCWSWRDFSNHYLFIYSFMYLFIYLFIYFVALLISNDCLIFQLWFYSLNCVFGKHSNSLGSRETDHGIQDNVKLRQKFLISRVHGWGNAQAKQLGSISQT